MPRRSPSLMIFTRAACRLFTNLPIRCPASRERLARRCFTRESDLANRCLCGWDQTLASQNPVGPLLRPPPPEGSLDRHALGEVTGLVHVAPARHGDVIGEEL